MRKIVRHERIAITQRTMPALKAPQTDTVLWDRKLQRFGVRLTPGGAISFLIQFRNRQGRSRRLTIGTYPNPWTPALAREEAERLLRIADSGGDPQQARQEDRRAITFPELVDEYLTKAKEGVILVRRGKTKKASTLKTDRYRAKHLTAHFGHQAVKNITQQDCQACLKKLIVGKHGATRSYAFLGALFSYAVTEGYVPTNPAHGVQRPADGRRSFRLEADGYKALGKALEAAEARLEPWQAVGTIRLLALTGCRSGEILKLRVAEVDFRDRCLRLGDTKSGESVRPLGEPALRLLKTIINRPSRPHSPCVFPSPRDPRRPFNGLGARGYGGWARIVGDGYTPHGLRHAFASAADDQGLNELTIAFLLGHADATKGSATRGYIRKPDAVLLAAADKVTRYIWQAMTGDVFSAEVVDLPRAMGAV